MRVILTLNFDRLVEQAVRAEGIEPTVVASPADVEGIAPLHTLECCIVHLHGDYLNPTSTTNSSVLAFASFFSAAQVRSSLKNACQHSGERPGSTYGGRVIDAPSEISSLWRKNSCSPAQARLNSSPCRAAPIV